jgi:hypothetical protein
MKGTLMQNSPLSPAVMLLAATMAFGCLDVPIIHVEREASDADASRPMVSDASIDAPDACDVCMRAMSQPGYGCGNEFDACLVDAQCSGTILCALARGCIKLPDQSSIINCGIPCAMDAGLDVSSPSLQLVIAVVMCGATTCGPICRGEVDAAPAR